MKEAALLPAIALSSVLRVDISSSFTYKGRVESQEAVRIVRRGSSFSSNGVPVSVAAIRPLLDALQATAMSKPTPVALQMGGSSLQTYEPEFVQRCDGVSATQTARDAFRRRFTDATAFARYLRKYYAKPGTPNTVVPHLRIVITTESGRLVARSSSRKAGMLPFAIARGGAPVKTYNAALPAAVAALLPMGAASIALQTASLAHGWELRICDGLTNLAFRAALPLTVAYAQAHGLVLHGSVSGNPIDGLTARVWSADNPRITMLYNADVSGGDGASVMALRTCSNVLYRVAAIPWLRRVLTAHPSAVVNVDDPSMEGDFLEAGGVQDLRNAGFGLAASRLARNLTSAPGFWVWLKPDKEATHWYLLANGDALLVHYLPPEERLPFEAHTAALVRRRGKPFDGGPSFTVGAIVTPMGKLEP